MTALERMRQELEARIGALDAPRAPEARSIGGVWVGLTK
jgi:hypothetical protein